MIQVSGGRLNQEYFAEQYFSINFHFLNNDKSYKRDFFTIYTIDDGLSFHDIKSILSSDIFYLVLYTIFGQSDLVDKASWSNQRTRINRDQSHLKEHIKMHRIASSEFCGIEFWYRKFSNNMPLFLSKTSNNYIRYF